MSRTNSLRKITFVIDTNAVGGTERYLSDLSRMMASRHQVTLICPLDEALNTWINHIEKQQITIQRFRIRHIFDIPNFIRFYRQVKKSDIVHFVLPCPSRSRLGILLAYLMRVPVRIATIQLVTPPDSKSNLRNKYTQKSIQFAYSTLNQIIAVSRENKRQLQDVFKIQRPAIKVIYNSIDVRHYSKVIPLDKDVMPFTRKKDKTYIAHIGRLHPQKGHEFLINAAPTILKSYPDCHFLFIGDGQLKQNLQDKINSKQLDSYFDFTGYCSEIDKILTFVDIVVLPSLFEGFPFVLLEAMAAAKPVVASAIGGNTEAIEDGITGFLVRPGDTTQLADRILFLLQNKILAKKMGQMGLERVQKQFNLNKMALKVDRLYQEMGAINNLR